MKGFIEVTRKGKKRLVNINHIIEVIGNIIYLDDDPPIGLECVESYEEIAEKIANAAMKGE